MVLKRNRSRKKRLSKRGGVDNLPVNINIPVNLNDMPMEESTPSQGSLHLSDLNVTENSMGSGLTTVESISPDTFSPNNSFASYGGKRKRKSRRKTYYKKSNKRRKSKSNKNSRKTKRGGADGANEDTSPVSNRTRYQDMLSYFN